MNHFVPTDHALFFTRNDSTDPRMGELCKNAPGERAEIAILGYPDDEGIALGGGRKGAAEGPDAIRHWLYRTTPHPQRQTKTFTDVGNLRMRGSLTERHTFALEAAYELLTKGLCTMSFGGGHDYGYADGMAFLRSYKDKNPLIINFDAHLDVRSSENGLTSGTPFYRLLESGMPFTFVEVGIQAQCNAKAHWKYVESKGGKIVSWDEISAAGRPLVETATSAFGDLLLPRRPTFLSLDIDVFSSPYATGSSAAWPLGLNPHEVWPLYQLLLKRLDVRAFGIYEVSPPLDPAGITAHLAAQFAHGFLHHV